MNNQDAKGLIKMPVAKYSRTGLPSGCRIIIILSKLTNPKEKKPRKTQRLKQNKTKPTYRITSYNYILKNLSKEIKKYYV